MDTGSLTKSVGTARGFAYSGVFDSTNVGKINVTPFNAQEFSLEATVIPTDTKPATTTTTGPQGILSNDGEFDGLSIDGTVVSFGTTYATADPAICSFDVQTYSLMHILGVHTERANSLYIDGELVATVTLTDEQVADDYASNDGSLYIGATASSQRLAISTVATYEYALEEDRIIKHANLAKFDRVPSHVAQGNGFLDLNIRNVEYNRYIYETYGDSTGWPTTNNSIINDGRLERPVDENGDPTESFTVFPFALTDGDDTNIYGCVVDAWGVGLKIEASLDNETWTEIDNHRLVSIINDGDDPSNMILLIKVTLLDTADEAFLEVLEFRGYNSGVSPTEGQELGQGRDMTITDLAPGYQNDDELKFDDTVGLIGNGSVAWTDDSEEEPKNVGTLQVIVKRLSAAAISFPTATAYINGTALGISNLPVGQWAVLHLAINTPANSSITMTGDFIIANAAYNQTKLTAPEILAAYKSLFSADPLVVSSSDSIGYDDYVPADDSTSRVVIYAKAWSVNTIAN